MTLYNEDGTVLGPRCSCGHWKGEHDANEYRLGSLRSVLPAGRCTGAYATLAADADDMVSVEVRCHCQHFSPAELPFEERL